MSASRARELQVAGRGELAIGADDLGEPVPHRARAPRERQFGERAALLAHATVVDAARLAAAQPALEQDDANATLAQVQRGRAAGGAAADDRDVGSERSFTGGSLRLATAGSPAQRGSRAGACDHPKPAANPHAALVMRQRHS